MFDLKEECQKPAQARMYTLSALLDVLSACSPNKPSEFDYILDRKVKDGYQRLENGRKDCM